jgi:predicted permease
VTAAIADLGADIRFALRVLRKSALATATIILCLGFSVGATGTVYAWTRSAISNPVPRVARPDRLVSLRTVTPRGDALVSYPTFLDLRDTEVAATPGVFLSVAATSVRRFSLRTDGSADPRTAEPAWGAMTSTNYFDVLGVRPALGRTFLEDEDRTGGAAAVVVISHGLWQRRFGGVPDVSGQRIWINNRAMTIVGVAPRGFHGTIARLGLDLWIPVAMQREIGGNRGLLDDFGARWLDPFARLAPGASLTTADQAAQAAGQRLAARHEALREVGLRARSLDVGPVQRMAQVLSVLLGLSLLVVLIVCSNVANLLLLRGASREHEVAVRMALGASSGRIVRQLMTESLLLSVGGVLVGVVVAAWSRNALASLAPASPLPIIAETPFDWSVVLLIAGVGMSTIVAFGLAPALRIARVSVRNALTGGGTRGGTAQGGRLRGALVSAQFALSLAVLATAGLFIQRLDELQQVDRGFRDPERVLLMTMDFDLAGIREDTLRQELVERLVRDLSALPGAEHAAAATFVPLGFLGYRSVETEVDGYVPTAGEPMTFLLNAVSDSYFHTMGIPIVDGRAIDATDRMDSRPVAVVNEAFAGRFWGGVSPVGRRVRLRGEEVTVVGVAGNGKYEFLAPLDDPSPPFIYLPFSQRPDFSVTLHLRSPGNPLALVPSVRRMVEAADARLTATSPSTLESYSSVPYLPIRVASRVLTVLGIAALGLATIGLYAVIGYAVTQQRAEIGIRMALGATPERVVRHFLAYAALYAGAGALAGTVLALAIARGLATRLPGSVSPLIGDQVVPFVIAVLALGGVAVVAAILPARAAARVNPTVALREE